MTLTELHFSVQISLQLKMRSTAHEFKKLACSTSIKNFRFSQAATFYDKKFYAKLKQNVPKICTLCTVYSQSTCKENLKKNSCGFYSTFYDATHSCTCDLVASINITRAKWRTSHKNISPLKCYKLCNTQRWAHATSKVVLLPLHALKSGVATATHLKK